MDWINIVFWLAATVIVVLGPIILIHELGHFFVAKMAGVRVEEFGFGFPPRMLRLWRGKGYFEIGTLRVTIPLGFRLPPVVQVGSRVDAIVRKRDDGETILRRLKVLAPAAEHQATEASVSPDELRLRGEVTTLEPGTLYSLNWLPMGAFTKMTGEEDPGDPRSLAAQPKRWRIAALAAGPVFNLIAAVVLFAAAYMGGYPDRWVVQIASIQADSAAAAAGLQPRDVIVAAGGERIAAEHGNDSVEHLRTIIRAAPRQSIELTVLRGQETLALNATPQRAPDGYGLLGIAMAPWPDRSAVRHYSVPEAFSAGARDAANAIVMTVQVPLRLIQGSMTPQEARPASVVGATQILAFALQQSVEWRLAFPTLQTAGLISLALGLTNLLPLPALDGARILFVLIEAVRRRRMAPEREGMVHLVGLVILVGLMILLMVQDVVNPILPWSWLK